ncbi:hypothetical protein TNCT_567861 [Trichonephila clavata]|uniref:Uncharacterized protein n=1 Tax=Trichonephila clavata TaxID=2740835 RepID=A0A8X6KM41_TRICU|nr:hypothetical protein TNCT_567861 [Trichonephila clavata]
MERSFFNVLLNKLKKIQERERAVARIDWTSELVSLVNEALEKTEGEGDLADGILNLNLERLAEKLLRKKLDGPGYIDEKMRKEFQVLSRVRAERG